jgi:ubiquinone/menaquinone biosynthesis C-methylase UbiE
MASFMDMKSIDDNIRQAILEMNDGRPPDNFIEDAQGGGLDAELLAKESPEEERAMIMALDQDLARLSPGADVLEDGVLRFD